MWYVNNRRNNFYSSFKYNFILTMWYVNKALETVRSIFAQDFILTMWYVNAKTLLDKNKITGFYIN